MYDLEDRWGCWRGRISREEDGVCRRLRGGEGGDRAGVSRVGREPHHLPVLPELGVGASPGASASLFPSSWCNEESSGNVKGFRRTKDHTGSSNASRGSLCGCQETSGQCSELKVWSDLDAAEKRCWRPESLALVRI